MLEAIQKNTALKSNPVMSTIGIHITEHGSSWLWAAFSLFGFFFATHAILYVGPTFKRDVLKKSLLFVPVFTNVALAFAYFTYASNLGYAGQVAEFKHVTTGDGNFVRQIFYTKYIGWFVAWPAALIAIQIATSTLSDTLTSEPSQNLVGVVGVIVSVAHKIIAAEVTVLSLLVGSLIHSTYKWGYFTFACVAALFGIALVLKGLAASIKSSRNSKLVTVLVILQVTVWVLYPVCWALCEGGNVIQPDSEAVFYGILDLVTFCFVPTALTWINISILNDEFFQKLIPFCHPSEKVIESPRHSGDTAVPQEQPVEV